MDDISRFMDMFNNSPIGILFYNYDGKLIDSNSFSFKILGISRLDDISDVNMFKISKTVPKKEIIFKEGLVKFQLPIQCFGNDNLYKNNKPNYEKDIYEFIISVVDSGFLLMIKNINILEKIPIPSNEEKYTKFFEDDLTGDFIATTEGRLIKCNTSFLEIYGFDNHENALKYNISKFNLVDWNNLINNLKNQPKIKGYQSIHTRPDGNIIHVIANVIGIFNDSNELIQVKGYIFDDTERKIAEKFLKESEEKYHRLFYEDLTGDFIADIGGKILECNPAFAEIYGFNSVEAASNSNMSKFNSFDWPYMVTRLKKEYKLHGFQSWQRKSDGLRIHVVANLVGIFNDSNELIQVKGYIFDDTERKHTEEELARSKSQMRKILDSIQDIFFALNYNWNFIHDNQCAAEYFGIEYEELIEQNLWKLFPELLGTKYEEWFRKTMESDKSQHFEAPNIKNKDHWFDFSVYPSGDGISSYWKDITQHKLLEEELKKARDHLKE
ncbi:MAG: PAS domain-containing protein [Methanobacterium sp.]|nr:PAS domain-containing protein [Methanobacterium sp.]